MACFEGHFRLCGSTDYLVRKKGSKQGKEKEKSCFLSVGKPDKAGCDNGKSHSTAYRILPYLGGSHCVTRRNLLPLSRLASGLTNYAWYSQLVFTAMDGC